MIRLNVILKSIAVAVLSTILVSGCTEECEETEWNSTSSVDFRFSARISGPNGTEISGRTVEFRVYNEPCGQPPKGHQAFTGITDSNGSVNLGWASYNMNNDDDLIVAKATLVGGSNPSPQTKTKTYRGSNLESTFSSAGENLVVFEFTP